MTAPASTPRVSCIIIFLDGEAYLDEAIQSVVGQRGFDDWELVLCDDGSTDASTEIAKAWSAVDPRITYLEHPGHENRGMSATRNLGLAHARGEYVAFLDCDDVWHDDKLATQVPVLDVAPHIDATVGTALLWYGWTGRPEDAERDRIMPVGIEDGSVLVAPEFARRLRMNDGTQVPAICSVLVRRRALEAVGGFEASFRNCYEDQVFFSKMGLNMTVHFSQACHERYRQHADSFCARAEKTGAYDPHLLHPTEEPFLRWLVAYVVELGMGDHEIAAMTRSTLAAYGRWRPSLLWNSRWRMDRRARVMRQVRGVVRRVVPADTRRIGRRLLGPLRRVAGMDDATARRAKTESARDDAHRKHVGVANSPVDDTASR